MAKLRKLGEERNWDGFTYVDTRGTRHSDPYKVLVLQPKDPKKTSPTYGDVFMFLERMLEVEAWNDSNLNRPPQLPQKIERLVTILENYVGKEQTIGIRKALPKLHEMM